MTRELGPVLAGLMVAGRIGAAMAAEIGTMRVTEQIDALTTLSTNPLQVPGRAAPARRRCSCCRCWCWSPTSSACSAAISSASTSSASTRPPISSNTVDFLETDGRGLRPGQGGGVRLHRRADGLLPRLQLAGRRAGRRRGDHQRRGLRLDPDPDRQLHHSPSCSSRDERADDRPRSSSAACTSRFGAEGACSTASISTCGAGESLVVIGGSGTGKSVLLKCILGLLHARRRQRS